MTVESNYAIAIATIRLVIGLKISPLFYYSLSTIKRKTKTNHEFGLVHCTFCICCALVEVIILVFVLRQSIENRSKLVRDC